MSTDFKGGKAPSVKPKVKPLPIALFGTWIFFIAAYTIFGRLNIQEDGVIVSRELTTGNRPVAIYTFKNSMGQHIFKAGPTDASLSRDFPVGAHIVKRRWHIGYTINGRQFTDFPIFIYSAQATVGLVILLIAARLFWNAKKAQ